MKIFDFTDGKKGAELANIKIVSAMGGWFVRKGDKVFKVELAKRVDGWAWQSEASWLRWEDGKPVEDMPIKPEDYGVGAICFCSGEWKTGPGATTWEWHVLGTEDWNREACKTGILKSTFSHHVKKEAEDAV